MSVTLYHTNLDGTDMVTEQNVFKTLDALFTYINANNYSYRILAVIK